MALNPGLELYGDVGINLAQELEGKKLMASRNTPEKAISVAIVHHANYKINKLKEKHLQNTGIHLQMLWLLSDFGNFSAASNMIAFLRKLAAMQPGDHILVGGFGAGTYYDVLAVAVGA